MCPFFLSLLHRPSIILSISGSFPLSCSSRSPKLCSSYLPCFSIILQFFKSFVLKKKNKRLATSISSFARCGGHTIQLMKPLENMGGHLRSETSHTLCLFS